MYVEWHDSYSIGVATVDQQHQKLFELLNSAYENLVNNENYEGRKKLVDTLLEFAKEHFAEEERYMEKYEYPDSTNHIKEHTILLADVAEFCKSTRSGEEIPLKQLIEHITGWIHNHMAETDPKLGMFLSEKGIK